jgi:2,4-dienoyl-CoA reductase-like NADH-dependent reductase (Old Yellow Enzyme family)
MRYPTLFSPIKIRDIELRDRIVFPPCVTNMDDHGDQSREWYAERARGGVGLVIRQATRTYLFEAPGFAEGLRPMADAVHAAGAAVAIQLIVADEVGEERVDVSARRGAREVTADEVAAKLEQLGRAAAECKAVGFDAVEPHGAHGFFMNRFFSPLHNKRTDELGGTLESRMQFGLRAVAAVREAVGPDFLILYRHTPVESAEGGYGIDDSKAFARELVNAGVDVLDISPSRTAGGPHAQWAGEVKAAVDVPVIAVGGMNDPAAAEAALQDSRCDLVAVGRGLIADAHWAEKVAAGREGEIIECIECNEKCYGNLRKGIPIGCAENPESGKEYLAASDPL